MLVLGIESSCDETAAAIVENGKNVLSNIVSSQIEDHILWGGVVPEIASRLHIKKIIPVIDQALKKAKVTLNDIDLIACSNRPGLVGALSIGVSCAKGIAWALSRPFIAINHIEAHLYSPLITNQVKFPYIGLLVSGGHTLLVIQYSETKYEILGTTIDDACGEAFDKVAKHYNIGYPGGPNIERIAKNGDEKAFNFPISNLYKKDRIYDVSYSGLKCAVINFLEKYKRKDLKNWSVEDIAASFQKRAFDILIKKVLKASENYKINNVLISGGVSANQYLRERFKNIKSINSIFPDLKYSTDNGAMVAAYAYYKYKEDGPTNLNCGVYPRVENFKISLSKDY